MRHDQSIIMILAKSIKPRLNLHYIIIWYAQTLLGPSTHTFREVVRSRNAADILLINKSPGLKNIKFLVRCCRSTIGARCLICFPILIRAPQSLIGRLEDGVSKEWEHASKHPHYKNGVAEQSILLSTINPIVISIVVGLHIDLLLLLIWLNRLSNLRHIPIA